MNVKKNISLYRQQINYEESFSANLKLLIKHYNLSIRELGRIINFASPHLTRLINGMCGNPGLDLLKKLSSIFNITIAQLIGEQEIDFKKLPKKLD